MKIVVMGHCGSGKSTLAQKLGTHFGIPALHLDTVHHLPGWGERDLADEQAIVAQFLDRNPAWVIDGNYFRLSCQRRLEEADQIILLLFSRFRAFRRVVKRYRTYKGKSRPDMAEGCDEKLDRKFVRWVLWDGRKKPARARFQQIQVQYPDKVTILRTQKQIDAFEREMGLR